MKEIHNPSIHEPVTTKTSSTMKTFLCFFAAIILGQIVGTGLFCVYLHLRIDKVQDEMNLNEDYVILRRLQKCQTEREMGNSLLNCKTIISRFQKLMPMLSDSGVETEKYDKQKHVPEDKLAKHIPNTSETSHVAAHLLGEKYQQVKTVLHWKDKGHNVLTNSLRYENGILKIGSTGLYYVYSQVTYSDTQTNNLEPFVQYIHLKRSTDATVLLKGFNTQNQDSRSKSKLYSIYQGGVFDLIEGDQLFVNVTDTAKVNYDGGATYFGIFKL
ncbi:CD40 ligand [Latimeria chalumnae]|uniref:CD40 ligand n=1 Tax=Latimeria chalumnae TaxID=7897 RepID=UPI0006D8E128|nr:CD40 ligand [Latimeria chalumnae]|eukprot:XP_014340690.1 PREDICTED: CD40 ligand [Latimeria chalumnae]